MLSCSFASPQVELTYETLSGTLFSGTLPETLQVRKSYECPYEFFSWSPSIRTRGFARNIQISKNQTIPEEFRGECDPVAEMSQR